MSLTSGGLRRGAQFRLSRRLAAGAAVVAALGIAPAAAQTAKTVAESGSPHSATTHAATGHATTGHNQASRPHVYLMRGLLNIFSLGMDQLAAQVAQNGIDASVYNHSVEESVVTAIVQKYRGGDHGPYILVGHSLGADAVMLMAQQLDAQGVPVALVVPFDGTASYAAPANVSCVVNLTQRTYAYMQAGAGFHGKLSNIDVSSDTTIDHITIDKSPRLQAIALKEILQAAHGHSCRPGQNAPAVARAKDPNKDPNKAPKEIAPKDNAATDGGSKTGASQAAVPATSAAPGKSIAPAKSAAPSIPAKNAPGKSAAPEKSAAAAPRSS
jgi:Thioesterase domain